MKIYKENYDPYCEYPDTDIRYSFEIKEDFDTLVRKVSNSIACGLIRDIADDKSGDDRFEVVRYPDRAIVSELFDDKDYRNSKIVMICGKEINLFDRNEYKVIEHDYWGEGIDEEFWECDRDNPETQLTIRPKEGGGCIVEGDLDYSEILLAYYGTILSPSSPFNAVRAEMTYISGSFKVNDADGAEIMFRNEIRELESVADEALQDDKEYWLRERNRKAKEGNIALIKSALERQR